jgi:hypothetical protein
MLVLLSIEKQLNQFRHEENTQMWRAMYVMMIE